LAIDTTVFALSVPKAIGHEVSGVSWDQAYRQAASGRRFERNGFDEVSICGLSRPVSSAGSDKMG
jgi:hypothetical protein